ncbi:type VI secretion system protein TssA [Providencia sp. Me31A]|uniref:type VI secretion system protein TssA n=1 Tax=Providencia sp. Me31A TaxID=3392637 RepID=UPI003D2CD28C
MINNTSYSWKKQLLAHLDEHQECNAVDESTPDWEYIDSEMIKFGSLSHGQLDIKEIQNRCLRLLETQTKDFRLIVHLLRTLQHAGEPKELVLAAQILADFTRQYWNTCYPTNIKLKLRLANQILKRFESVNDIFCRSANSKMRDDILGSFAYLAQFWHEQSPNLSEQMDTLSRSYQRIEESERPIVLASEPKEAETQTTTETMQAPANSIAMSTININQHDERQWKQTLLQVSELICLQAPESSVGYRLRRYAIWYSITMLPQADHQGKTPLAPVSIDRIMDYKAQLTQPSNSLLNNIEQSLSLSPYWLEGHMLAAQTAAKLGYSEVADGITEELRIFLARLPNLVNLHFSDMSPFIPDTVKEWLEQSDQTKNGQLSHSNTNVTLLQQDVLLCYEQQGLEAALKFIESSLVTAIEPRDKFYGQLLSAQLFELSGMEHMAVNLYQQLYNSTLHFSLEDWEPSLVRQLVQKTDKTPETTMTMDRDLQ